MLRLVSRLLYNIYRCARVICSFCCTPWYHCIITLKVLNDGYINYIVMQALYIHVNIGKQHLCIAGGVITADVQNITIPVMYNLPEEALFKDTQAMHIVKAHINCPSLKNSAVELCAELPGNWNWDPDHGLVYLNVFTTYNDSKNADVSLSYLSYDCQHYQNIGNASLS